MIGPRGCAVVDGLAALIANRHRPRTSSTRNHSLQERRAFSSRACTLLCVVGGEAFLVGEKRFPSDVRRMMVLNDDCPLRPWALHRSCPNRAIRIDHALGVIPAKDVRTGICWIRKQPQDTAVRQMTPPNLARPGPTVGAPRK